MWSCLLLLVKCAELEEPNGGNYSLQTTGTQTEVVFSCALGSTLKGISRSKCLPNGQWEVADNQTCGMNDFPYMIL